MNIPLVGNNMIEATLFDLEGKKYKLSDFSGKYILIDFWSMTCMPCMFAAKELHSFAEKYKDEVYIIGVNMDKEKGLWEQGTRRDNITWPNLSDGLASNGGIGKAYGIHAYPAYVLINPQGVIADRWMGFKPGKFETKIRAHLER